MSNNEQNDFDSQISELELWREKLTEDMRNSFSVEKDPKTGQFVRFIVHYDSQEEKKMRMERIEKCFRDGTLVEEYYKIKNQS